MLLVFCASVSSLGRLGTTEDSVRDRMISYLRNESFLGWVSKGSGPTHNKASSRSGRHTSLAWPSGLRLLFAASWGLGPLQRQAAWRHGGKGASSGQVPRAVSSHCSNTQAIQLERLSIALQIHTHPVGARSQGWPSTAIQATGSSAHIQPDIIYS